MNELFHHDQNNVIQINSYKFTLEQFLTVEPGYQLPSNCTGQYYDRTAPFYVEYRDNKQAQRTFPNQEFESYIDNADEYALQLNVIDIEQERNKKISEIINIAESARRAATKNAGQYKVAGWAIKTPRAERIVDGEARPRDIRIFEREISRLGLDYTVEQLATAVVENAERLATISAEIEGAEKHASLTMASADIDSLDMIVSDFQTTIAEIMENNRET